MFESDLHSEAPSARDVATALRARLPGLSTPKLHKLLYYCQGHHLAAFGRPLFGETVFATDTGPVVEGLSITQDGDATPEMDEAQLNTIGYVLSRYRTLTAHDLENLTRAEDPSRLADVTRQHGHATRIRHEWMAHYFGTDGDAESTVTLDSDAVTQWLAGATARRDEGPARRDDISEIRARGDAVRGRSAASA